VAAELDELVRKGWRLYPIIRKGSVTDPDVVEWARHVRRERRFLDPFWEGFFRAGVYKPLRAYYSGLAQVVAAKARGQYDSGNVFDVSSALEGLNLEGTESSILGKLAKDAYFGQMEEERLQKEYMEKVSPHIKKEVGRRLLHSTFFFGLLTAATGSPWYALAIGGLYFCTMQALEGDNCKVTAAHAGIEPRTKGEASDLMKQKKKAVEQLMHPYR
jgi:hypothetical protein